MKARANNFTKYPPTSFKRIAIISDLASAWHVYIYIYVLNMIHIDSFILLPIQSKNPTEFFQETEVDYHRETQHLVMVHGVSVSWTIRGLLG